KVVDDTDDIIMISSDGIIIRLRAADIRVMGRYATGVRLMRVGENEMVVAFTRAEHEEDAQISDVEDNGEEDTPDPENEDTGEE
ncbi:MAG: hypothetical protein IJ555_08415, partial [Ruminococcus sp.]|nr:hypothetical protein [Ruminococcus sp.]